MVFKLASWAKMCTDMSVRRKRNNDTNIFKMGKYTLKYFTLVTL